MKILKHEFGPDTLVNVLEDVRIYVQSFPEDYTLDVVINYLKYGVGQQIWTATIYYMGEG